MKNVKDLDVGILPALYNICTDYIGFCQRANIKPRDEIVIYANRLDLERRTRVAFKGGGDPCGDEISSRESRYK